MSFLRLKNLRKKINTSPESKIRIARFLAMCGISSRRKCEQIILEGRVKINGQTITDLSDKVSPDDEVKIDDKPVNFEKTTVIAVNKPPGFISTASDKFERKIVLDLVPGSIQRLYPVGRLDMDSRGLIILTNDGDLAYRLTHPKFGIEKVYDVLINGKINRNDLKKISEGIDVEGRELHPAGVELIDNSYGDENSYKRYRNREGSSSFIRIKISEGRKRIIRKVFKLLGYDVLDLKRIQIGNFKLSDYRSELSEGKYKILNSREIKKLTEKS